MSIQIVADFIPLFLYHLAYFLHRCEYTRL